MRKTIYGVSVALLCMAALGGAATMVAQDATATMMGPPPILMTVREYPKLGMERQHVQKEMEQIAIVRAAKFNLYTLALRSITGDAPRVVFLTGYESMANIATAHEELGKMPDIAKLDKLIDEDEAMLDKTNTAIWRFKPELSSSAPVDMASMRMAVMVQIVTKEGHSDDFESAAKKIIAGWTATDPTYTALIYASVYGGAEAPSYLVILPIKSLSELDKRHEMVDAYHKAVGEEGMKELKKAPESYLSDGANLFAFAPRMSYVPESWLKEAPDFWTPKPLPMEKAEKK